MSAPVPAGINSDCGSWNSHDLRGYHRMASREGSGTDWSGRGADDLLVGALMLKQVIPQRFGLLSGEPERLRVYGEPVPYARRLRCGQPPVGGSNPLCHALDLLREIVPVEIQKQGLKRVAETDPKFVKPSRWDHASPHPFTVPTPYQSRH